MDGYKDGKLLVVLKKLCPSMKKDFDWRSEREECRYFLEEWPFKKTGNDVHMSMLDITIYFFISSSLTSFRVHTSNIHPLIVPELFHQDQVLHQERKMWPPMDPFDS